MNIGIDASFLRRPGTGIGQVTYNFLRKAGEYRDRDSMAKDSEFFLYCEEEPNSDLELPENFHIRSFLPFWKRDDVPRKMLWERSLGKQASRDNCTAFLSLSQSSAIMPEGIRHIMIVHDLIPRLFPEYVDTLTRKLHWKAIERGIGKADRIIAVSKTTRTDVVSELGVPEERVAVAYPDCDPRFRTETGPDADTDRVMGKYALAPGYIYHGGGLEIRKNTEGLLRAYAAMRKRQGRRLPPLVISGKIFPKDNRLATDVRGIMRDLDLEESVILLGFVPGEDLPELYRGASMFVYPSLYEGFGLPVLEAFASGAPVIAGRAGSIPEIAGDAALLVDPTKTDEIAAGLVRLHGDVSLRAQLAEKGKRRAGDFSWDTFLETTLRIIQDDRS